MTENQLNRKEMHDNVDAYLDQNVTVWSAVPIINTIKTQFKAINISIAEAWLKQNEAQVFVGQNKALLKRAIAEKADILNDQIEIYASLNGDSTLEAKMSDSMSDLLELRNQEFILKVDDVVLEAENNLAPLTTDYGVTQVQVDDLKGDADTFRSLNGMPRKYQIESVVRTQDLKELFTQANQLLIKMDKLMKIFKNRNTSFYNGYVAARNIINN
nr:hypothetical protein [uncultured Carboxylicivirga sp.]